jgi:hypothetical protein
MHTYSNNYMQIHTYIVSICRDLPVFQLFVPTEQEKEKPSLRGKQSSEMYCRNSVWNDAKTPLALSGLEHSTSARKVMTSTTLPEWLSSNIPIWAYMTLKISYTCLYEHTCMYAHILQYMFIYIQIHICFTDTYWHQHITVWRCFWVEAADAPRRLGRPLSARSAVKGHGTGLTWAECTSENSVRNQRDAEGGLNACCRGECA